MNIPNVIFSCLLICIGLFSCKENEVPDGGPCSYSTSTSGATVIEIEKTDSLHSEIKFAVVNENNPDSITYSQFFHEYATAEIIQKYDLQPGNVFSYEEHYIVKGACTPKYYSLTLKKFDEEKK
ncbi:hypothetical protein BH11BAC7_BH11BAC7_12960 [soil metagenome]